MQHTAEGSDAVTSGAMRFEAAPARRRAILQRVRSTGFCSIADLAGELAVSEMTVRRDVRRLDEAGDVRVVHGGVSLPPGEDYGTREHENLGPKTLIGQAAAALIGPGDTIAVDAGTTTHALVDALPLAFAGSVVTHSVPVMQALLDRPESRCVGLGGDLYPPSRAFVGPATVEAAARLRVRWCFLGAAAVDERGCYGAYDLERPTKQALMDIADHVVLLVDAGKFHSSAPVLLERLDRFHTVVTDTEPPAAIRRALESNGTALSVAAPAGARV
ncbi:DeoR/GlpR family DNA-binding transcription regulator [Streptomyces rapamycinicus]|uniref:Lactose phosphotransferase system repressor n=1 Tax=Streptomyces rapamycinicus TaxID=1226757 RepID=A0ABR6LZZ8_9ACTN|nr:DeoR/GlpR family DNA-binding transcription regulator [Streptomyces rapamycinicus]MBB4786964.1 DeoR/GlpR family transcriptional regulator of sugar metabolism [Streptomyces rapamycinicus]UTO66976.1 DeoR/GlpR family DNA-binding transcription regulator [Streptomyces rapamycinicus]UTP34933.1 DeoR/GlpR family DNA-binding transcription regulator [Streptomyces rapamycinicus NRRL 5491]